MDNITLEQIIKQYIVLPPHATGTGWHPVLCKICNDKGHKGARAGFKFEQNKVTYHCFNCGHAAGFNPDEVDQTKPLMSTNMIQVMRDFSIPDDEWNKVQMQALATRDNGGLVLNKNKNTTIAKIEPEVLEYPENFYPLKDADINLDKWALVARHYLKDDRHIDPNSYPFMIAHKSKKDIRLNKWVGRIIIPIFKDNKLVYYQGRDLTGKKLKKYESPAVSKDNVIYGFDKLFKDYDQPLYIVEGWFDAEVIGGIALMGNTISSSKIAWINKSTREKVYIPDQFGDGIVGAMTAIKQGWSVSTPEISDCKDMNDAVGRFGKMYVMKTLAENTSSGLSAELNAKMWCK